MNTYIDASNYPKLGSEEERELYLKRRTETKKPLIL